MTLFPPFPELFGVGLLPQAEGRKAVVCSRSLDPKSTHSIDLERREILSDVQSPTGPKVYPKSVPNALLALYRMPAHACLLSCGVFLMLALSCRFPLTTMVGLHVAMLFEWCVQDLPSGHSRE